MTYAHLRLSVRLQRISVLAGEVVAELDRERNFPFPQKFPKQSVREICGYLVKIQEIDLKNLQEILAASNRRLVAIQDEHVLIESATRQIIDETPSGLSADDALDNRLALLTNAISRCVRSLGGASYIDEIEERYASDSQGAELIVASAQDARSATHKARCDIERIEYGTKHKEVVDFLSLLIGAEFATTLAEIEFSGRPIVVSYLHPIISLIRRYPVLIAQAGQKLRATANTARPVLEVVKEITRDPFGFAIDKLEHLGDAMVAFEESFRRETQLDGAVENVPRADELQADFLLSAEADERLTRPVAIRAPMVGTAYLTPEPGAEPFVTIGAEVEEGQQIMILEAMKVMNPITAPEAGVVSEILVSNGDPVEYDESMLVLSCRRRFDVRTIITGTAYLAAEPGAEPFVRVGTEVKEGQILMIIEAMKVMNPIRAPGSGIVSEIIVSNGDPVEYNELLIVIN